MIRVIVVYDISDDKARKKVSDTCLDYGLDRHQYSVFSGLVKPTHLRELAKLLRPLSKEGQVTLIPVAADDWEKRVELGASKL
ncbi:MAG TPA: CRISPR-associated endonuclease Cas2 [Aggregatilinea sp.]|uniref:CRISPR-associated endonuclease Cas2 n=1 Tax=Aggregatilinea sp. TaxID=2806333 RepID=UPI002B5B8295|nr:CRISPR-associated endonuclease Cas2 [Aggregatilinea sp.]HML22994.1 CRISPR-associated endonuclease Cas2 [Aggregatilinea sp.]